MSAVRPRIQWSSLTPAPSPGLGTKFINFLHGAVSKDFRETNAIVEMFHATGVPLVEGAQDTREQAVGLLKLAAEIEHALLVQYLYSCMSISGANGDTSEDPRQKQLNIAIQEMGHLATVENLLLLVGGRDALYLQRDVLREASGKNPLPFVLEPLSRTALAKYVLAERPLQIPNELQQQIVELQQLAEAEVGNNIPRVGAIYAVLKWIFLPAKEANNWVDLVNLADLPPSLGHLSDADLTLVEEMARHEALPEEWHASMGEFILETPRNCDSAIHAIEVVSSQGEGIGATERSHFEQFLDLLDMHDMQQIVVAEIAREPKLRNITDEYTGLWAEVFVVQYQLLMLCTLHALRTARDDGVGSALRDQLAGLAMRSMRRHVLQIANVVVRLPMRSGEDARAGPPFDLDPAVLETTSDTELVERHIAGLDRLAQLYAAIRAHPNSEAEVDHKIVLANLETFDRRHRALFQEVI